MDLLIVVLDEFKDICPSTTLKICARTETTLILKLHLLISDIKDGRRDAPKDIILCDANRNKQSVRRYRELNIPSVKGFVKRVLNEMGVRADVRYHECDQYTYEICGKG